MDPDGDDQDGFQSDQSAAPLNGRAKGKCLNHKKENDSNGLDDDDDDHNNNYDEKDRGKLWRPY